MRTTVGGHSVTPRCGKSVATFSTQLAVAINLSRASYILRTTRVPRRGKIAPGLHDRPNSSTNNFERWTPKTSRVSENIRLDLNGYFKITRKVHASRDSSAEITSRHQFTSSRKMFDNDRTLVDSNEMTRGWRILVIVEILRAT